jgi:hypothetical protein
MNLIKLITTILIIISYPEYQPGDYTWCNQVVFSILQDTGYDISCLLNPDGRWNTNANDLCFNAIRAENEHKIVKLTKTQAMIKALQGKTVLITSYGVNGSTGHCAVVFPCPFFLMIAQAGKKNGVFLFDEVFTKSLSPARFYELPKKRGK